MTKRYWALTILARYFLKICMLSGLVTRLIACVTPSTASIPSTTLKFPRPTLSVCSLQARGSGGGSASDQESGGKGRQLATSVLRLKTRLIKNSLKKQALTKKFSRVKLPHSHIITWRYLLHLLHLPSHLFTANEIPRTDVRFHGAWFDDVGIVVQWRWIIIVDVARRYERAVFPKFSQRSVFETLYRRSWRSDKLVVLFLFVYILRNTFL